MKIIIKILCLLCICTLLLNLTACSGVNQLHEKIIVQGVGIDTQDKSVEVTMQIFDAENSFSNNEGKIIIVSAIGETVLDAFNNISKKTGKEPLYSQNLVLIIGQECASNGINSVMDFFIRYYEVRPSVSVFIAKGNAKQIFDCNYEDELITCEEISSLSSTGKANASGKSADVTEVVNALVSNLSDPAVMAIEVSKDDHGSRPVVFGTAIFNNDKLIGFLDSNQSKGFLLLSEDINGGTFVMDIDDIAGKATMTFDHVTSYYSFDISEDNLKIYININTELNLYALDNAQERKLSNDYVSKVENTANKILNSYCLDAVNKSIKEYKSDTLNLAKRFRLDKSSFFKQIENSHRDYIVNADYIINVKASLKNIGQEMSPI